MTAKRSDAGNRKASTSGDARRATPETVEAALALAARHGRNAFAEALLAGHALLDAASLALTGLPAVQAHDLESTSDAVRALARVVTGMDALAERLRSDEASETRRLIDALLAALDSEITRWEREARDDADARAVLRAFLGLRELLWELGLRPRAENETDRAPEQRPGAERQAPRGHGGENTGARAARSARRPEQPDASSTSPKRGSTKNRSAKSRSAKSNAAQNNAAERKSPDRPSPKRNPAKGTAPPRRRRVQRVDIES